MSYVSRMPKSLLTVLILGLACRWSAAANWPDITPEEKALTSVPGQPGAPAVILNREEVDDDTTHDQRIYMRIKILTEAGRRYADVELPYNREHFNVSDISGRTVHADGSIVPFQSKPFDKVVVKGKNIRIHVKAFSLPDVQVGSILDFRYNLGYSDNSLFAPRWIVQNDLFQKRAYFKYIPFQFGIGSSRYVEVERDRVARGVAWTTLLPKPFAPKDHNFPDGSERIDLEVTDVPAFVEEPYMPPSDPIMWHVYFYYRVDLQADDYWKNEGKYWDKTVESFLDHHKGIAEAVASTVAASDSPETKARKIYAFVSSLQNRSYDPRGLEEQQAMGMQENKGADDVLRQRSGDHDDLNRLFVAMVRAAGLQAWLMRVPEREDMFFQKAHLSMDQFDGEIAIVQIGDKEVFLDPGSKFCPFGLTSWHYSDDEGLRESPSKGTEFTESPAPTYKQAMIQRVAHLQLTKEGRVEGTLMVGFLGIEAMDRRREGGHTDDAGRKKLLEDEVKTWLPGGSEVTMTTPPNWTGDGALIAQFKISAPVATSAGHRWIIPTQIFEVNEKPLFASAQRTNPIYFYYPSQEVDEVHITFPPGMDVENLPPNDQVHLDYALYETTHEKENGNGIVMVRNLIMGGIAFPATEYNTLKTFYDKVKAADDQPAVLRISENAAAN